MSSYLDDLTTIAKVGALVKQAQPDLQEFSADHVAGTQALIMDAATAYAQNTTDTTHQQEAIATAELASVAVPAAFALFSWFKRKADAKRATKVAAQPAQGAAAASQ